jgi:hypothetical protein
MESKISAPAQYDWADTNLTESTVYASTQDTIRITAALDAIDLSALGANANLSLSSPYTVTGSSPYTVTGAIGTSHFPNSIWTTTGTNTLPWLSSNPTGTAPKITLNGEGADVEVNGWSLVAAVKRIEERLGLFQPNPELEAEWADLRELGEQYRQLEQHIKEKQATFDRLKAMPPPEVE